MNIKDFLIKLDEDKLEEGKFSGFIKRGVDKLKTIKIKALANAFFKKYPGLLEVIKAKLSGKKEESLLEEGKFAPKLILIGILLAIAAGIVPVSASDTTQYELEYANGEVVKSTFELSIALGFPEAWSKGIKELGLDEKNITEEDKEKVFKLISEKLGNPRAILSSGKLLYLKDKESWYDFLEDAYNKQLQQIIIHDNKTPETGEWREYIDKKTSAGKFDYIVKALIGRGIDTNLTKSSPRVWLPDDAKIAKDKKYREEKEKRSPEQIKQIEELKSKVPIKDIEDMGDFVRFEFVNETGKYIDSLTVRIVCLDKNNKKLFEKFEEIISDEEAGVKKGYRVPGNLVSLEISSESSRKVDHIEIEIDDIKVSDR
jgi:hypothetical protein